VNRFMGLAFLLSAATWLEPTPTTAQDARFQPVAEGTLDTQTGLVWGFSFYETGGYLKDIGIHEVGESFHTWAAADNLSLNCEDANGVPLPGGFCTYPAFSNWYAGRNDTDWRLPTKAEFVAAAEAGLVAAYDASPAEGLQPAEGYREYWTADTFRERGRDRAYTVMIGTGAVGTRNQASPAYALAVRGVDPPPEQPTKGNGKPK